jgi:serine/threonine protein kinase
MVSFDSNIRKRAKRRLKLTTDIFKGCDFASKEAISHVHSSGELDQHGWSQGTFKRGEKVMISRSPIGENKNDKLDLLVELSVLNALKSSRFICHFACAFISRPIDDSPLYLTIVVNHEQLSPLDLVLGGYEVYHRLQMQIGADLLRGLAVLHEKGLLHRDLCPSRVLVNTHSWHAVLSGFAHVCHESWEDVYSSSSPYRILDKPYDRRSDICAAGRILHHMMEADAEINTNSGSSHSYCTLVSCMTAPPVERPVLSACISRLQTAIATELALHDDSKTGGQDMHQRTHQQPYQQRPQEQPLQQPLQQLFLDAETSPAPEPVSDLDSDDEAAVDVTVATEPTRPGKPFPFSCPGSSAANALPSPSPSPLAGLVLSPSPGPGPSPSPGAASRPLARRGSLRCFQFTFSFFLLPSSFFLLPSSFFLLPSSSSLQYVTWLSCANDINDQAIFHEAWSSAASFCLDEPRLASM